MYSHKVNKGHVMKSMTPNDAEYKREETLLGNVVIATLYEKEEIKKIITI